MMVLGMKLTTRGENVFKALKIAGEAAAVLAIIIACTVQFA